MQLIVSTHVSIYTKMMCQRRGLGAGGRGNVDDVDAAASAEEESASQRSEQASQSSEQESKSGGQLYADK